MIDRPSAFTRPGSLGLSAGVFAALLAGTILVVHFAAIERAEPARCPAGLVQAGAHCCGEGQQLAYGACSGRATHCSATMLLDERGECEVEPLVLQYPGGRVTFGATDWHISVAPELRDFSVKAFRLDRAEVTIGRWQTCVAQKRCRKLLSEAPGLPVRDVAPEEAEAYCQSVGGRLPTSREWLFAAAGAEARRFPWGNTGLVCRRVAFGLADGPCAVGATHPELAGARPDGATREGALDLSGNVAEWTREPDDSYRARGGSYAAKVATELRSVAEEVRSSKAPHIGFRCAYD